MKRISIALIVLLAGCATNQDRYDLVHDQIPNDAPSLDHIENAHPRYEPYSIAGNKDYHVMGKDYQVIQNPQIFSESGTASWYGEKFHGHETSNGEIYDMYSMTAAHKTLPLPSYVAVENTDTGKKIIVRVNDRGPFHEGRVIDLSYAAAGKLGMLKTGTAPVKVTLIKVPKPANDRDWQHRMRHQYFVQLSAMSDQQKAMQYADQYGKQFGMPTHVRQSGNMYRIRLGPFYDDQQTKRAHAIAKENQLSGAFIVVESKDNEPSPQ